MTEAYSNECYFARPDPVSCSIQFTGRNNKGEGDYINGFAATCAATDDLTKQLGDPAEKQLAAALTRRSTGTCAPLSGADAAQQAKALAIGSDKAETDARTQLTGGRNLAESAKLLGVPRPANEIGRAHV